MDHCGQAPGACDGGSVTPFSDQRAHLAFADPQRRAPAAGMKMKIGMVEEQAENVCPDPTLLRSAAGVNAEEEAGGGRVHGDHPVRC